ncbi:helix-turn-helix transcriptional regulator [Kitasatospora sp. NPDC051705]|uniref:helix-turn-helix transcriptional regulator n=1 Tax=Kitasatospora sp. NPDC051705 TaxID=3364057 RepID=UPI00378E7608
MLIRQMVGVTGRDVEQALLEALVTDVAAGRGSSLLVEGEPGIGKSALLAAPLAAARAAGCAVLLGHCDELAQRLPLSAMTRLLGVHPPSADPRHAQAAPARRCPQARSGRDRHGLATDPVTAATEQLLTRIDRLCTSRPLVLALEDLHRADEATLLLWRRLCRTAAHRPLLAIGTCRPAPSRPALVRLRRELPPHGGQVLSLDRLSEASVTELAGALTGGTAGPRLAARLTSAAGNPLYVRELLNALERAGSLHRAAGTVELPAGGHHTGELRALTDVIADRLACLSADARQMLRLASLLGPAFSTADLTAAARGGALGPTDAAGRGRLLAAVDEALSAGVLEPAGTRLRFRHALLQEVLHEAMPPALRTGLLQHAAQQLIAAGAPVERVAELILPAVRDADGWEWKRECEWLADNAARLADRAPGIAAELLEHALRQTDAHGPRHHVLADRLATLYFRTGPVERAEELARTILLETSDRELAGRARWLLTSIALRAGRYQDVEANWRAALGDPRLAPRWRAGLLALLALARGFQGRLGGGRAAMAEALAEGVRLNNATTVGYALNAGALIRSREGDQPGALVLADLALAQIGDDPEPVDLRLMLLGHRAVALDSLGRPREAEEALARARTVAERTGATLLSMNLVRIAERHYEHGRWDDAQAVLDEVTDLPQGRWQLARHSLHTLISARRDNRPQTPGHPEAAATPDDEAAPPTWPVAASYRIVARSLVLERTGRPREALDVLAVLLARAHEYDVRRHPEWLVALVRLALAVDDRGTARAAALESRRNAHIEPLPATRAAAGWCQALLHDDPDRLRVAIDHHRAADRPPDLGNALEDLAVLRAASGDRAAARAAFGEALALYAGLGAVWDARRAAARLRPWGVRAGIRGPRSRPASGRGALTATEQRVADLLAQGLSNPDIAAMLLLSRRTVETHVSHILGKLGVRSRHEVAAATAEQPPGPSHRPAAR